MIPFGIFGLIAYFLYYFINSWYLLPTSGYENLGLRAFLCILFFLLILKNKWPNAWKLYLPIYWYFTLLCAIPFFVTFMTLKNNCSAAWIMNLQAVIILMMLLVDWISYSFLLLIGILCAWACYYYTTPEPFLFAPGAITPKNILDTFSISLVMGIIFSRKREQIEQEKLQSIKLMSFNIAHELRTPLAAINAGASGLKDYLPDLIETYKLARQSRLPIPLIHPAQFDLIKEVLETIEKETYAANTIINMLLINFDQSRINTMTLKSCSIKQVIEEALGRYPFLANERKLVHWQDNSDFIFYGETLLTVHILFNLLKNAIYYINARGQGEIYIWLETTRHYHVLHFKDTGQGISSHILPYIFDKFFSRTYHGFGIGLAFCKMVMNAYGGDIRCFSQEGEFTEFLLRFPR